MPVNTLAASPYMGRPIFAIHSALDTSLPRHERGKLPRVKNWQHSQPAWELTRFVNGELGYAIEPTVLVLDVDVRDGKQGFLSLQKLAIECGVDFTRLSNCIVRTGSGGLHIYLQKPANIKIKKTLKTLYPDIDFLGEGCFVVTAGSLHACGEPYTWVTPQPLHLAPEYLVPAPARLLGILQKREIEVEDHEYATTEDTPEVIEYRYQLAIARAEAAEAAIEGAGGDDTTFKVLASLRDMGVAEDECFQIASNHWNDRNSPPWSAVDLRGKVRNVYQYASNVTPLTESSYAPLEEINAEQTAQNFVHNPDVIQNVNWTDYLEYNPAFGGQQPKLAKSIKNCRLFLRHSPSFKNCFAYNQLTNTVNITTAVPWLPHTVDARGLEITDPIIARIRSHFIDKFDLELPEKIVTDAVVMTAQARSFHPIQMYMKKLNWDGVDRVSRWLHEYCRIENTTYTRAIGARWLVGAVKRVMEPGCQMDNMLILYGKEGIGKSSAARILGGHWYLGSIGHLGSAKSEAEQSLRGKWIAEFAELDNIRKAEWTRVKDFLTRTIDTFRVPYDKFPADFPRQIIFIGTTNEPQFLQNEDNRRFWAVKCEQEFNTRALEADRDQIWAQAYQMYLDKFPTFLETAELQNLAKDEVRKYAMVDPWQMQIKQWLDGNNYTEHPLQKVQAHEILQCALGGTVRQSTVYDLQRVQKCLRLLGWVETQAIEGLIWVRAEPAAQLQRVVTSN